MTNAPSVSPKLQANERLFGLDLLRIISMFMVLILHILGQGGVINATASDSTKNAVVWFVEISAYCAVNCYALISGYVGLRSKFKYTNIAFLWLEVLFYTLGVTVLFLFINSSALTANSYWTAILPVTKRAYWYFTAYFCTFFFTPLINFVVENMKKVQVMAALISAILLFSFIYTLARSSVIGTPVNDLLVTSKGYSPLWLAILYFIGACISKYRDSFRIKPYLCLILYFLAITVTWVEKMAAAKSVLFDYTSPTILLSSLALLLCFSQIKCTSMKKIIGFFAPLSFGVYLIHVNPLVWVNFMKGRFAEIASLPIWAMIGAIFLTAICLYLVCSLIDALRHYLFKLLRIKERLYEIEKRIAGRFSS